MGTESHSLSNVYLKIERAKKHISDCYAVGQAFLDARPYDIVHRIDPDTGEDTISYGDIKNPPRELSLFIGDAIHNLRTSLDFLACQIIKLRDSLHDCEYTYFPISESAQKFETALQKAEVKSLGEQALQILQELQPYKEGKGHGLWQLHRLDIQDKHRLLIVATAGTKHFDAAVTPNHDGVDGPPGAIDIFNLHIPEGEALVIPKKGDAIIAINSGHYLSDGKLNVHGNFTIDLAFGESQIMKPQSVYYSLVRFSELVTETVSKFAPLFP